MPSRELENLVIIGALTRLSPGPDEVRAMLDRGATALRDAANESVSIEGRFALAYSAAHGLAVAALWHHGYRSANRITVFECLTHTTDINAASRKLLISTHKLRNHLEYEAEGDVDPKLVRDLILTVRTLEASVRRLIVGS